MILDEKNLTVSFDEPKNERPNKRDTVREKIRNLLQKFPEKEFTAKELTDMLNKEGSDFFFRFTR